MTLVGAQSRVSWSLTHVPHPTYGLFDVRAQVTLPAAEFTSGSDGPLEFPVVLRTVLHLTDLAELQAKVEAVLSAPDSDDGTEVSWIPFHGFVLLELSEESYSLRLSYLPESQVGIRVDDTCGDAAMRQFAAECAEVSRCIESGGLDVSPSTGQSQDPDSAPEE